jgi:hypothetical protein
VFCLYFSIRNRKIKALEKDLDHYRKRNIIQELQDKLKDPRFLSESNTNRQIILNTFFKHKFNEITVEKDRLSIENEDLRQKIEYLEKRQVNGTPMAEETATINSDIGEDEVQIYTYILIKNFEVMKLTGSTVEEVNLCLKKILFKDDTGNMEEELLNRFISLLRVKNKNDKQRLSLYIKSLFKLCSGDYNQVKQKLTSYFGDITVYKEKKEKKMKKKLKKVKLYLYKIEIKR